MGISASDTNFVPLMNFQSKKAAITSGMSLQSKSVPFPILTVSMLSGSTYRYEETKSLVDQPPFVKTEKPPVKRMTRHMNSATGDV
jgi:hypothetical protein